MYNLASIGRSVADLNKIVRKRIGGEDVVLLGGRFVPIFALGIFFSQRFILNSKYNRNHRIINVFISIVYLMICESLDYFLMEMFSVGAVYIILKGWLKKWRIFQNPILLFLGDISYCIYLTHNELGRAVILHLSGSERVIQAVVILSLIFVVMLLSKWINCISSFTQKHMESTLSKISVVKRLEKL